MHPVEGIPGPDAHEKIVCRHVYFPQMYDRQRDLIWLNVFEFPECQPESLAWEKYARIPIEMHDIGVNRERQRREMKPDFRYEGFISAKVTSLREITSADGKHGFRIQHEPLDDARYHVHIYYCPSGDICSREIRKLTRTELRLALQARFSPVVGPPPISGTLAGS
jgi:hypothetical protein